MGKRKNHNDDELMELFFLGVALFSVVYMAAAAGCLGG